LRWILFTDEARTAGKQSLRMVERGGKQKGRVGVPRCLQRNTRQRRGMQGLPCGRFARNTFYKKRAAMAALFFGTMAMAQTSV